MQRHKEMHKQRRAQRPVGKHDSRCTSPELKKRKVGLDDVVNLDSATKMAQSLVLTAEGDCCTCSRCRFLMVDLQRYRPQAEGASGETPWRAA